MSHEKYEEAEKAQDNGAQRTTSREIEPYEHTVSHYENNQIDEERKKQRQDKTHAPSPWQFMSDHKKT